MRKLLPGTGLDKVVPYPNIFERLKEAGLKSDNGQDFTVDYINLHFPEDMSFLDDFQHLTTGTIAPSKHDSNTEALFPLGYRVPFRGDITFDPAKDYLFVLNKTHRISFPKFYFDQTIEPFRFRLLIHPHIAPRQNIEQCRAAYYDDFL